MRVGYLAGVMIGIFSLVGCGGTVEWVHPNKPKDMFAQDYNQCENTVMNDPKVQRGTQYGSKAMMITYVERCLAREGWYQVEKP